MLSVSGSGSARFMERVQRRSRHSEDHLTWIHKCILLVVFLYLGISIGLLGSTLIYIEKLTASREDEVALIFSSRAVGSLAGWLLGLLSLDLDNFEPTTLMSLGTFGLFVTHLLLPWALQLWWVFCGFTFQGALMAITVQGCLAYIRKSRPKHLLTSSQQLVFVCLFGSVICPFIMLPFFQGVPVVPKRHGLDIYLNELVLRLQKNTSLAGTKSLPQTNNMRRQRRSVDQLFNHIGFSNSTMPEFRSTTPGSLETSTSRTNSIRGPHFVLEKDLFDLNTTTVRVVQQNQTVGVTQKTVGITPSTTTSTTLVPKKPSVIDASHLKQDASSADGSNTASKLKQLGEERRMENAAGPPKLPAQSLDNVNPMPAVLNHAPETVVPLNITKNITNQLNITKQPTETGQIKTTKLFSDLSKQSMVTENYTLPIVSLFPTTLPTPINSVTTSSSTTRISAELSTTVAKQSSPSRTTTAAILPGIITSTVLHSNTTVAAVTTVTPAAIRTSQHHRIVEHSVTAHFAKRFLFTQPLQPIQRVYYFLSALGLLTWLLTLTLTGWCQGLRCTRPSSSKNEQLQLRTRNRRCSFHGETTQPLVSSGDVGEHSYNDWLPVSSSAPGAVTNLLSSPNDSDEDSLYVSAQEYALRRDFEPVENQTRGPGKAIRYEILPRTQRPSITGTHEPTVSLFAAQWPKVSWPSDAWLLLAEFFIAGLETAFSGFVHGFTVRYLIWSPSLGFLANSLFWFGELVGRLPCLFLVRFKPVKKPPPRIASSPIQHRARERTDPRGSAPMSLSPSSTSLVNWKIILIRIFGGLVCTFSAVALTRFSLSSDGCSMPTFTSSGGASPAYVSWLGGSLFMGLGIGIASSSMVMTGADISDNRGLHRIQLAGLIGQMLIPATVGYVHHLVAFWRYACVLSTTALIFSVLITLVLSVDLLFRSCVRSPVTSPNGSTESNISEDPESVPVKLTSSPVTLHVATDD